LLNTGIGLAIQTQYTPKHIVDSMKSTPTQTNIYLSKEIQPQTRLSWVLEELTTIFWSFTISGEIAQEITTV
jgi:hypothetical protein